MGDGRTVISIGTFDGVHLGHAALIGRALRVAGQDHGPPPHRRPVGGPGARRVVALCFDPHPMTKVRPEAAPARLTTFETRERELRRLGASEVVRLEPTEGFLALSARDFVEKLVGEYTPAAIVEGADFRFGHGRKGDVSTLGELGRERGFAVEVVPSVDVALTDQTLVKASSTMLRWLISQGRVRDAALILGRPYELTGTVVRGDRRGRTIGFPTANLATECLLPADGVYAGIAHLEDGRSFGSAVSVGTRPTFDGLGRRAEAYFLDVPPGAAQGDVRIQGLPEYGWPVRLEITAWLREDLRFDSGERLAAQIRRDCTRAREALGEGGRTVGRHDGGSSSAGVEAIQSPPIADSEGARVAAPGGGGPEVPSGARSKGKR